MSYREQVIEYNKELKNALQAIYDELNHGQRQKIQKNEYIKALFLRFNIGEDDA